MNKRDKIKLLQGIKEGVIPTSYLSAPKTYVFTQELGEKSSYKMNDKKYTEEEYLYFCRSLESKNKTLQELGLLSLKDNIITIVFTPGKTIL